MAGYGGYFMQGLSQGMQSGFNMGNQIQEMKWKREEKAKLKKQQDDLALAIGEMQGKATDFAEGGWTSQEVSDFSALIHAGSIELQSHFNGYLNSIENGDRKRVASYSKLIDEWTVGIGDMPSENMSKSYETFRKNFTDPDALKYLDTNYNMKQSTSKTDQVKYFSSVDKLLEEHGKDADYSFVQNKGFVYIGQKEKTQPKSSDYVNMMNVLGAVAINKTDEQFQAFKKNMEAETGISLGDLDRKTFIDLPDPEEIRESSLDDVFFGTRGIMNEYIESADEFDDEMKNEIRNKWKLIRPLMSASDQQKGDKYLADIGIDLNASIKPVGDIGDVPPKDKGFFGNVKEGFQGMQNWINDWIETPQLPNRS